MKISLSPLIFKSIRTRSSLLPYGKPVTISIPTKMINNKKIKSSLMPNLIHSLDASNIHILCKKLNLVKTNLSLYTIHDCFATTPNNMEIMERNVKAAFIDIYFKDQSYIEKMHNHIIDQIKSFIEIDIIDGKKYIEIDNERYLIPEIPKSFLNQELIHIFIRGINNSKFFIS